MIEVTKKIALFLLIIGIALGILGVARDAEAYLGASFGGRIVYLYPYCLNGGTYTVIAPAAGSITGPFMWIPGLTITKMAGPPRVLGGGILGLASGAYQCVISYYPYVALPAMPMTLVGTSAGPMGGGGVGKIQ